MHRRSAISRLAAGLAGLSLGEVPSPDAAALLPGEPFSSGTVTCPICQEMGAALELTPAGPCLRCADRYPAIAVEPHTDPFWILSPQEIHRLEPEIQRLAAELDRMNDRLVKLGQQRIAEGSDGYDRAMEAERDKWHALQRELHLLHLLRAASRQFGGE